VTFRAASAPRPRGTQTAQEVAVTTDKSGRTSAGILLWRRRDDRLEVLLAHMGGPYWVNKDLGHWTIPKGEVEAGEELVRGRPPRVRGGNRPRAPRYPAHRAR